MSTHHGGRGRGQGGVPVLPRPSVTPPALQDARWAAEISTALGIDEIATAGGSGPEIVTAISPRMMTRPVTDPPDAPSASCQTTDDTSTAQIGDLVTVEHRGICDRVATGMITKRDLEDKYEGDSVATINGKSVEVGGDVSLTATDVGAATPAALASHTHNVPSAACKVVIDASTAWTGLSAEPGTSYSQSYLYTMRARINDLYDTVNAIAGNHYCDGCGKAGATSTP